MKHIAVIIFLSAICFLMLPAVAQTPTAKEADELATLLKEVQAQQAEIAQNQTKIDDKLATLGETLREARIFSSRGGR
jgi:hypothetical protein